MSVQALKVVQSPPSELEPFDTAPPGSLLARIGGARHPRGLSTLRQIRKEQARVYLAAKRGDIPPEMCTRLTYVLRELARTLEAEGTPVDLPRSGSGSRTGGVSYARAMVEELCAGIAAAPSGSDHEHAGEADQK